MTQLISYTPASAPGEAAGILQHIENQYGFLPNAFAAMGASPVALKICMAMKQLLEENCTLSREDINLIQLVVSVYNKAAYSVAVHTTFASLEFQTDTDVIAAIRAGKRTIAQNSRFDALVRITYAALRSKGRLNKTALNAFFKAGFEQAHLLEVYSIIHSMTIGNYVANLMDLQLDEILEAAAWPEGKELKLKKVA